MIRLTKIFFFFFFMTYILPSYAAEHYFENLEIGHDGDIHHIRYGFWFKETKKNHQDTLIVYLQGIKSFMEKYVETIQDFNNLGFDVFSFDWRSQGGSSRFLPNEINSQKIHIPSFDTWLDDFDLLLEFEDIKLYQNIIVVGMSMGGHLLLRNLLEREEWKKLPIKGAVFLAPMIDIHTYKLPYYLVQTLLPWIAQDPFGFAMGMKPYDFERGYLSHQLTSNDLSRSQKAFEISKDCSQYVTSGLTWHFLNEMIRSIQWLHRKNKILNEIPSLWIIVKNDSLIDNSRILEFMGNQSELKIYDDCKHNLIDETDEVRKRMFADMNWFIAKALN